MSKELYEYDTTLIKQAKEFGFAELQTLKKLLVSKKLTDNQRQALASLIKLYFQLD